MLTDRAQMVKDVDGEKRPSGKTEFFEPRCLSRAAVSLAFHAGLSSMVIPFHYNYTLRDTSHGRTMETKMA